MDVELLPFFAKKIELSLPIVYFGLQPLPSNLFEICGCSPINNPILSILAPTEFLHKLVCSIDFNNSSSYGDGLYQINFPLPDDSDVPEVQWCLEFLYMQDKGEIPFRGTADPNYKYLNLYSFVYGFLGISQDTPYNYIFLNYLEYKKYIYHGSGIRSGVLNTENSNAIREPSQEHRNQILEWIDKCNRNGGGFQIDRPWLIINQLPKKYYKALFNRNEYGTYDHVLETMLEILYNEVDSLPLPKVFKPDNNFWSEPNQLFWSEYNIKIIYNNTYYILTAPELYNYKTFNNSADLTEKALVMARAINFVIRENARSSKIE